MTLADGMTAIFRVTGVRVYVKTRFPAKDIYGATDFAVFRPSNGTYVGFGRAANSLI